MSLAIGLGLVLSFFYLEIVGLSAGGLIVPGYLAVYWGSPWRIVATFAVALASYCLVSLLSNFIILYSRRRFLITILAGFIMGWLLDLALLRSPAGFQDVRAIGYIIPGLIANDMIRQGVLNTVVSVLVVTALVRLILLGIG
jgi:poly-gamma-glutamate biosynthesis protein PgsC/CapC